MRGEGLRRVEQEIRQAKAEALGRAGERVEAALAELAAHDRSLDALRAAAGAGARDDVRVTRALEARNRVRDRACRLIRELVIQREAIGLVRHGLVRERYPVPPVRSL